MKIWGGVLVIATVGLVLAWQYVGAPPPRQLRLATGVEGGGYDRGGLALRDEFVDAGIDIELVRTAGSVENLTMLRDGKVDLAFVQGGVLSTQQPAEGGPTVEGIASAYYEPLWVFVSRNADAQLLADLKGKRLQIGAAGSGTRAVAEAVLAANGVDGSNSTFQTDAPRDAIAALRDGRADALFLVTAPDSEYVASLFTAAEVRPFDMTRAHAFSRRFRYLAPLTMTRGMLDLAGDLPKRSVNLLAPAATLLARADLHPSVPPLLIEAMQSRYGAGNLFEDSGEFPTVNHLDVPASKASRQFFRDGPSFLYRVLPFQVAASIDRLKVMLLPLLTLLLPLLRVAPPIYRWRIRNRIIRWYKEILRIERSVRRNNSLQVIEAARAELTHMQGEIGEVTVPLGYAEELYNLRMHVRLVLSDLDEKRAACSGAESEPAGVS